MRPVSDCRSSASQQGVEPGAEEIGTEPAWRCSPCARRRRSSASLQQLAGRPQRHAGRQSSGAQRRYGSALDTSTADTPRATATRSAQLPPRAPTACLALQPTLLTSQPHAARLAQRLALTPRCILALGAVTAHLASQPPARLAPPRCSWPSSRRSRTPLAWRDGWLSPRGTSSCPALRPHISRHSRPRVAPQPPALVAVATARVTSQRSWLAPRQRFARRRSPALAASRPAPWPRTERRSHPHARRQSSCS